MGMNKLEETSEFDLNWFLILIRQHRNLIFLSLLISMLISFYYTFTISPVYQASTSLIVKNQTSATVFDLSGNNNAIEMENEKLLIKSNKVAERTAKKLFNSGYKNRYTKPPRITMEVN